MIWWVITPDGRTWSVFERGQVGLITVKEVGGVWKHYCSKREEDDKFERAKARLLKELHRHKRIVKGYCFECHTEFTINRPPLFCPNCDSQDFVLR